MIPLPSTRFLRLSAALVLIGSLCACTGYAPDSTTDSMTGAVSTGTVSGGGMAERSSARDQVVCEYDPLYGRDVCYRN